ncbi:Tdh Threonine dehydrogenase and related Zn-dependent dehydrogenases [actinobacterium SCGC AAA044-D11]
MKTLITSGDGSAELVEVADPIAGNGELLVAPIAAGICGTDLEIISGDGDPAFVKYPASLGHEWTGRVIGHGPGVTSPAIGSRIVVTGIIPCQTCFECKNGDTNRCLIYDEIGFTRPGAAADLITVPAWLAHVVSENVSDESAVLAEPTAVVTQAFMKANPKSDSKILIIGDGTIALIAATMAKIYKPKFIHMLGLKDGQNEIAKSAGVDEFLTSPTDEKYDLIIEAAGAPARISAAIGQLVRGGTLLLLGYPGHQKTAAIVVDDVINGDLNIIGSFGSSLAAWQKSVEMFNSGELDLGYLVTHKFKLSEFADAIEALKSAPAPRGKIALIIN